MNKDNVKKIHAASMEILENIGVEVQDDEVLEILSSKGIKVENKRAYFTEEQINKALESAPNVFNLYARNPKYDMTIGKDHVNYVSSAGATKIRSVDGSLRDTNLDDYLKFTKLIQSCDSFKIIGPTIVELNDIDPKLATPLMMYIFLTKSDKCIFVPTLDIGYLDKAIDLMGIALGDKSKLKEKPMLITVLNTTSPLKICKNTLALLKRMGEYRQPVVVTPAPMAGSTGPITLAGNIAMQHAETISTIAITQLLNPGTPAVYGSCAMVADMSSLAASMGSPEFSIQASYAADLAALYDLPTRVSGNVPDANGLTIQSGYESMMSMYTAIKDKSNFIFHSAGALDGFSTISYEKFIADLEIISMLETYFNDIVVDDSTLAVDVIKDVVGGKIFLNHKHTVKRCRKVLWKPLIAVRENGEIEDTPENLLLENINKRMDEYLDSYETPNISEEVEQSLRKYMLELGIDEAILDRVKAIGQPVNA
ncbi:MAG: trimethylamine methyltransferase family protein [Peptostreptococcaceae bacterium]